MNLKDSAEIIKKEIDSTANDKNKEDALKKSLDAMQAVEKVRDLIFKYRCSAVTLKNQKTYFTDHDIGYCKGALDVFEQTQEDIEGVLKRYDLL